MISKKLYLNLSKYFDKLLGVKTSINISHFSCGGCFLDFFSSLINIALWKYVFKASERLLFSLFIINQDCTTNVLLSKMYSRQAGDCFLVYYAMFLIK